MNKDSKTIYVVFQGYYEYEDIIGYCTTRKEARAQCAMRNSEKEETDPDFHYYEVPYLDGNAEYGSAQIGYLYDFFYRRKKQVWKYSHYCGRWYYSTKQDGGGDISMDIYGDVRVRVFLHKESIKRARQIAQSKIDAFMAGEIKLG